ncbi:hypothetical protein NC652_015649 [Populus alba x Populus x berolinensis]|nr:hypothetical protein NC652_015649 [Populus alba x Populus x berolinensis]
MNHQNANVNKEETSMPVLGQQYPQVLECYRKSHLKLVQMVCVCVCGLIKR